MVTDLLRRVRGILRWSVPSDEDIGAGEDLAGRARVVVKRNYYILHYFYVPTASWMGGRCYEPTIEGLSKAVDDYIKLATGTPAVPSSHIGAVTIHEPGGALPLERLLDEHPLREGCVPRS